MTQELVVWVLVAGLVGLVWVFTCVVLTQDRSSAESGDEGEHTNKEQADVETPIHTQRRIAA